MIKKFQHLATQMLDQASGARTPKIYYNPEGDFAQILAYLPQLRQKYRPTPWLSNPHAHLLYFDLIKKKQTQFEYDRIDHCQMPDGGVTAIAWYGLHLPKETPIIIVLHTITGSPKTMAELVRDLYVQTGWKIALCLRRGHAALPLTVPKVSLFGFTEDLRIQLNNIQEMFPDAPLYAVGSSAGTGLLVRYLGEEGSTTPLRAAFALCPGYNTEESFSRVHPFYSKFMTKNCLKHFLNRMLKRGNRSIPYMRS